jgi:hypothetical protein
MDRPQWFRPIETYLVGMDAAPRRMEVTLRYSDGCPNWRTTNDRLLTVLRDEGKKEVELILERVESDEDAQRLRFIGSPTILIDGHDPFGGNEEVFGLTCRVYETPEGLAGAPTLGQLREAIRGA